MLTLEAHHCQSDLSCYGAVGVNHIHEADVGALYDGEIHWKQTNSQPDITLTEARWKTYKGPARLWDISSAASSGFRRRKGSAPAVW